jgi:hypothetical protein
VFDTARTSLRTTPKLNAQPVHGSTATAVAASLIDKGQTIMKVNGKGKFVLASATTAALFIVGAMSLGVSRPAAATQAFASETGKECGQCHVSAKGGGTLTPFGEKFKANGNKLP